MPPAQIYPPADYGSSIRTGARISPSRRRRRWSSGCRISLPLDLLQRFHGALQHLRRLGGLIQILPSSADMPDDIEEPVADLLPQALVGLGQLLQGLPFRVYLSHRH